MKTKKPAMDVDIGKESAYESEVIVRIYEDLGRIEQTLKGGHQ